ncbi:MAG: DUF1501 domain-containing protein [Planctomycetes bacterium]|nr:DUF1501 domain-containing protein [Planctomycetota bacterium]
MTRSVTAFRCPGPLTRRSWLQFGGLSLGALAGGLDPRLTQILRAAEPSLQATTDGNSAPVQSGPASPIDIDDGFSVILLWANGGPSHLETFDLKPAAPAEIRGPFRPVATNVPGLEICEHLPRLARLADKFSIVRNLHHNRAEHSGGTHRLLTGYSSIAANLQNSEFPDIGSVVARRIQEQGRARDDIPTFVANSKSYGGGPAYLGPGYAPFMPGPSLLSGTGSQDYAPVPLYLTNDNRPNFALSPDGVVTLRSRYALLETLDALARTGERAAQSSSFDQFQRRAVEMLTGTRTRAAFEIDREDAATRRRYGDSHWGKSLLTARRLVESGVRFVQVLAGLELPQHVGRITSWDDHSVNSDIFKAYEHRLPMLDQAVSAIVEDLYDRGLDKRVLFIFCGEFGRTPTIRYQNPSDNRPGRDHWPRAMSIFLSGGGLQMGKVVGATSARGEEPAGRAFDSNCLLATIYRRFGIDTSHEFHDQNGRPFPILRSGEPIAELL